MSVIALLMSYDGGAFANGPRKNFCIGKKGSNAEAGKYYHNNFLGSTYLHPFKLGMLDR